MMFLCECRGPCRRTIDVTPETYRWLQSMGAMLSPACAERERRDVVYRYNGHVVVATTTGTRVRPPRSL